MILAGYEDIHKSLDEFEFGQDLKADYGVSCPKSPLFLGCY